MPAARLTPGKSTPVALTIRLDDLTYELGAEVLVRIDVEMSDGLTACLGRWEHPYGDLGDLPNEIRESVDGFLWGEGLRGIILVCQKWDRSAMSKRVRAALRDRE